MKQKKDNLYNGMQKAVLITILFINIGLMFFNWFGRVNSNINIQGLIILTNPLTIIFLLMYLAGVILNFKKFRRLVTFIGLLGFIAMELWYFFTWHLLGYYQMFSIEASVELALETFFIGILTSIVLLITTIIYSKKYN